MILNETRSLFLKSYIHGSHHPISVFNISSLDKACKYITIERIEFPCADTIILLLSSNNNDSILVLKDGSVIESGPSDQILSNPNNEYTKTLIDASDGSWYKTNKENVK